MTFENEQYKSLRRITSIEYHCVKFSIITSFSVFSLHSFAIPSIDIFMGTDFYPSKMKIHQYELRFFFA